MISAGVQKLRLGSAPYPGPGSRVLLCRRRGERGSTLLPPLCPAMSELTGPPSAHSAPSPESHDGAPQGANGAKAKRKRLSKVCLSASIARSWHVPLMATLFLFLSLLHSRPATRVTKASGGVTALVRLAGLARAVLQRGGC
jgi:hypothetical protein